MGNKPPGQEEQAAKQRQSPGIKAEAGQISQQGPAHPANIGGHGLAVKPAQLPWRALQFDRT